MPLGTNFRFFQKAHPFCAATRTPVNFRSTVACKQTQIAPPHSCGMASQITAPLAQAHPTRSPYKRGCGAAFALTAAAALAGCVTPQMQAQNTEQMLAASGFLEKPANTPRRVAKLASLPPYRILSQRVMAGGRDTVGYIYADPQFCHCVFVGDPAAYQHFQQYALQQKMTQEQIAAQEMAANDAFGWDDWGPYPYWGGGVVVVGGAGFHGGFHGR
jgi:hypothetical protein